MTNLSNQSEHEKKYKFHVIDEDSLGKVTSWVQAGRGITIWKNLYIGDTAGSQITPGDADKPHWKYGDPEPIDPKDIEVEHRVKVDLVPEWYPKCDRCKGSAKRSLQELADIRKEPIEVTREMTAKPDWNWGPIEDDHFPCNYCRGTGHTITRISFKVKRTFYGGLVVSDAGKRKSNEMVAKLKKHHGIKDEVTWDWEWIDAGMAESHFYSVTKESLAEYLTKVKTADGTAT